MKSLFRILSLAAALSALAVAGRASPVLFAYDWDTGETILVADNSAEDTNAADGAISWNGLLGEWSVNFAAGVVSGAATSPTLELSTLGISSGDGGTSTLSLYLFGSGFGPSAGLFAHTLFTGATAGAASYALFQDNANGGDLDTFDFSTAIADWAGPFGPGAFSGAGGAALVGPASLYSLALGVQIEHGGGIETSGASLKVTVPDHGVTALLFAFGLAGLGLMRRRLQA